MTNGKKTEQPATAAKTAPEKPKAVQEKPPEQAAGTEQLTKKVQSLAKHLRNSRETIQALGEYCDLLAERLDKLRNRVNLGPQADKDLW